MPDLPTGTVTSLFTDVEGSRLLAERHPASTRQAEVRHEALLRAASDAAAQWEAVGLRPDPSTISPLETAATAAPAEVCFGRALDVSRRAVDEDGSIAAWSEGRAMPLAQAVASALEELAPTQPPEAGGVPRQPPASGAG